MKRLLLSLLAGIAMSTAVHATDMDYRLEARAVAPDVYVFIGKTEDFNTTNGGNIVNTGFIVGPQGVVVIDTGPSLRYGRQMRAAIARVTDKPVVMAINTHHHPDHFLGNQAFADVPIATLADVQKGIATDGNAFAENLFRMSGDWMAGTEVLAPTRTIGAGPLTIAGKRLRVLALDGHTGADLALLDEASGVLFAGDLVFDQRAPTTPHADIDHWLTSLAALEKLMAEGGVKTLVPGHGPVSHDAAAIRWTRDWLVWLTGALRQAADQGLDMNETLTQPLPERYRDLPVARSEYRRSVARLFPQIEAEALAKARPR
jgi:quinoprotein relay system zinc metallohydrolase 1